MAKDKTQKISFEEILKQAGKTQIEVSKDSVRATAEAQKYAMNSFSVHFVKLHVHPVTGVIKLKQIVSAADAGKITGLLQQRRQWRHAFGKVDLLGSATAAMMMRPDGGLVHAGDQCRATR